jgi:hypothetical protein
VKVLGAATQLANLQHSVIGVGPGTSFYDKLGHAQVSLAASDAADSCGVLGAFIREVNATQSQSAAASLVTSATRIGAVMGCWPVSTGLPSERPGPGPGHSGR